MNSGCQTAYVEEVELCKVKKMRLAPGRLYRFVVEPECEYCKRLAQPYMDAAVDKLLREA